MLLFPQGSLNLLSGRCPWGLSDAVTSALMAGPAEPGLQRLCYASLSEVEHAPGWVPRYAWIPGHFRFELWCVKPSTALFSHVLDFRTSRQTTLLLLWAQDLDAAGLVALTAALSTAEHQSEGTDQLLKASSPECSASSNMSSVKGLRT